MVDSLGRINLKSEFLLKASIQPGGEVFLYFNPDKNIIIVKKEEKIEPEEYFLAKAKLEGARMNIPYCIRKIFSKANFLVTLKKENICIIIINGNKKTKK